MGSIRALDHLRSHAGRAFHLAAFVLEDQHPVRSAVRPRLAVDDCHVRPAQ